MSINTYYAQEQTIAVLTEQRDRLREDKRELLAALKNILAMDVRGHTLADRLQFSEAGRSLLEPARAAIAKAEEISK